MAQELAQEQELELEPAQELAQELELAREPARAVVALPASEGAARTTARTTG